MELRDRLQEVLGPDHTVEHELGGGGMSRVFVATEKTLDRRVVVKVLPRDLAQGVSVDRFKREIMVAAALQHPHIVGVISAGEIDGLPFFVMPYVEGESLRRKIDSTDLATGNAAAIARIHLGLGNHSAALRWLDRAADAHDPFFGSEPLASPLFDPIRRDPRFAAVVRKTNLNLDALSRIR